MFDSSFDEKQNINGKFSFAESACSGTTALRAILPPSSKYYYDPVGKAMLSDQLMGTEVSSSSYPFKTYYGGVVGLL